MNDKKTPAVPAVDFSALESALGGGFWYTREAYEVCTLPLDSIENVKRVSLKAGRHSKLWKAAHAKWIELSTEEVAAAKDASSADKAFDRIPTGEGLEDPDLLLAAIIKCASFRNTFTDITAVVERCRARGYLYYGGCPEAILEQLFPLAKVLKDFVYLYQHGSKTSHHGGHEDTKSIRSRALPRLMDSFLKSVKRMAISAAFKALDQIPQDLRYEAFRKFLKSKNRNEKELRAFIRDQGSQCGGEYKNIVYAVLDVIVLRRVEKTNGLDKLESMRGDVAGLPQSSDRLQKKIDQALTPGDPKTFAEAMAMYQSTSDFETRGKCWRKMMETASNPDMAEQLYGLVRDESEEEREAHDIWLSLCGDDWTAVTRLFDRTHSTAAYAKMLTFVIAFSDALKVWNCAAGRQRDEQRVLGFKKVLECIHEPNDGFELLATHFSDGYGSKRDAQTHVVLRMLEVCGELKDILRLARSVKNPTWEARAAIILKLAKFYPAPNPKSSTARAVVAA